MTNNQANILVVEDEALVAEDLKAHITELGHKVNTIVPTGEDALALLEGSQPDLVLMDIVLAGEMDGIDVAAIIKQRYHIPVIYLTAYTDREKVERAQLTEPYGYLVKPFDERELRTTISMALYKAEVDRKLRESQRWAGSVLSSISDGVITLDRHGLVQYLNPAAEAFTGWSLGEASGCRLAEVFTLPAADAEKLAELSASVLQAGQHPEGLDILESELQGRDGARLPVSLGLAAILGDEGEVDGLVIAFQDASTQRQAKAELEQRVRDRTQELQAALLQARAATVAKNRFLANMSHELRTPLNPIIGYAELLMQDKDLRPDEQTLVADILGNGRKLLGLVDDTLSLAEAETGELELNPVEFNVLELLHLVELTHRDLAEQKGLAFSLDIGSRPPSTVIKADPIRLRDILERLLDNALKFTEKGSIVLKADFTDITKDQATIRFSVTDSGSGIPREARDKIFEPLTQLDDSTRRKHGGTGLGLAVASRLVTSMGGRIGVEDNPSGGSIFWFELALPFAG